ncbi:hypothetical protein ACFQUU_13735 [Herbaspirillum sp. GCM10030257]|uniref:hypothetical protein n=1 Tax=Herbaspirillum sp. GCM10030257 TaxID=3273393 RepID=UPI00360E165D
MLSSAFIDWWFEPWVYAESAVPALHAVTARAGRRDGYRIWCEQARVAPDLPMQFDPAWQIAAVDSATTLVGAARLFAGLIAARQHDSAVLDELGFDERKWCVSVAATQPLVGCRDVFADGDTIELRGLCEIARRLDKDFPGLWSRLRLLLAPELATSLETRLALASRAPSDPSATRAQRCWALCRNQAETAASRLVLPAQDEDATRAEYAGQAEYTDDLEASEELEYDLN